MARLNFDNLRLKLRTEFENVDVGSLNITEKQRTRLDLFLADGELDVVAIAELLDVSEGTVRESLVAVELKLHKMENGVVGGSRPRFKKAEKVEKKRNKRDFVASIRGDLAGLDLDDENIGLTPTQRRRAKLLMNGLTPKEILKLEKNGGKELHLTSVRTTLGGAASNARKYKRSFKE